MKKNIRGYNETQLKTNVEQLESYETQIKDLRLKVEQQQGICDAKQEKIDHLSEHEYDPDCQYCSSNIFVQNAIEAQNTISADLQILNILRIELIQLNILSDELLESATAYGELQKYKLQHQLKGTEIEKQELQLQIIENELQTRESELETSLERQESFRANESAIKHNKLVDLEINTHKQSIDKINLLIKDINESIRSKHGLIEVAKITTTVWLRKYWDKCGWLMKSYLVPAVIALALLTSMGIFGFLSKAHIDQGVPTGDVAAKVSLIEEKIKTQRDNIKSAREALVQMDAQVNNVMNKGDSEKSAERSVLIRRQQASERGKLQKEIEVANLAIGKLNEEKAPIASQLRKVEAEVGPIKYIAAMIYGDNPDQNI